MDGFSSNCNTLRHHFQQLENQFARLSGNEFISPIHHGLLSNLYEYERNDIFSSSSNSNSVSNLEDRYRNPSSSFQYVLTGSDYYDNIKNLDEIPETPRTECFSTFSVKIKLHPGLVFRARLKHSDPISKVYDIITSYVHLPPETRIFQEPNHDLFKCQPGDEGSSTTIHRSGLELYTTLHVVAPRGGPTAQFVKLKSQQ